MTIDPLEFSMLPFWPGDLEELQAPGFRVSLQGIAVPTLFLTHPLYCLGVLQCLLPAWETVLLCSPGWLGSHCRSETTLNLRSAHIDSPLLGFEVCATALSLSLTRLCHTPCAGCLAQTGARWEGCDHVQCLACGCLTLLTERWQNLALAQFGFCPKTQSRSLLS